MPDITIKPWQWASLPCKAKPVEIVSYPFPREDGTEGVMVRMKVGDPTSIREVPARLVAAFEPDRHEDFYREKVYYSDNPTAFIFKDELEAV